MAIHSENPDAMRDEFIELLGQILQAEGLPRNAGRILGLLIYDGDQKSFGTLAETLKVSRGSISSSSRLLEEFGLIRRGSRPGERQDYFSLEDNPYGKLLERGRARAERAKTAIVNSMSGLPDRPDLEKRISDLTDFYRTLEACIDSARVELSKN